MNFTSASDFQFVTGDLDEIEIDNDIMPVRTGDDKLRLRGMDVAFLMEAVEERRRAAGLEPKSWTFSKETLKSQLEEIQDGIVELYASGFFLKPNLDTAIETSYTTDFNTRNSYLESDYTEVDFSDSLFLSEVSALFSALELLKCYQIRFVRNVDYPKGGIESYVTVYDAQGTNVIDKGTLDETTSSFASAFFMRRYVTGGGDTFYTSSLKGMFFSKDISAQMDFAKSSRVRYLNSIYYTGNGRDDSPCEENYRRWCYGVIDSSIEDEELGEKIADACKSEYESLGLPTAKMPHSQPVVEYTLNTSSLDILYFFAAADLRDRTSWT